ncbi:hypothetical protein SCP_0508630 [Sparassis crispa]|uniref:CST complex subunit STN1 n=1 Tax=Sparassis crispa TaxID=139825 RepID=A0A401GNL9_9APHY|nr:hypothetical protein SCP_0508630 [Sparassis crispa]GBE83806.1 hypothetical protein SCP_0508630 [Sparassis crispa]
MSESVTVGTSQSSTSHSPSAVEIWKWTLTSDAVASCFVKDVFDMRDSGVKDAEFFWLGRVPCRTVRIIGILVGVQIYEQRTVYSLDDGSAVIECVQRHSGPNVASPMKSVTSCCDSPLNALPPKPPKPVAQVGKSVCIVGRVTRHFESRKILVDSIVPCAAANDEPKHWLAVLDLHSSYYFASHLPAFTVPASTAQRPHAPKTYTLAVDADDSRKTPKKPQCQTGRHNHERDAVQPEARDIPTPMSIASSVAGSSPSSSSTSSPVKPGQSPPRLRHPSRLHTRDLTANTFRIYIKHYMDHAPPPTGRSHFASTSSSRSPSPCPPPRKGKARVDMLTSVYSVDVLDTPTKRPRYDTVRRREIQIGLLGDATPRPSRNTKYSLHAESGGAGEQTPRPPLLPDMFGNEHMPDDDDEENTEYSCNTTYGVTLSHLRRVPELAQLAYRVVDAEGRRRAREERKRAEAGSMQDRDHAREGARQREKEPKGPKMRRLFRFAIRQLYEEGSIVLWDGPVRPLPSDLVSLSSGLGPAGMDALWRTNASTSIVATSNVTVRSSVARGWHEDETEEPSDPPPGEEAYISLTPAYFLKVVEQTIRSMMAATASDMEKARAREKQKHRSRAAVSLMEKPSVPSGPTPHEILVWLHRDERWARVGEWTVREALEWGRSEGRVWCVGRERWEVCG